MMHTLTKIKLMTKYEHYNGSNSQPLCKKKQDSSYKTIIAFNEYVS